MYYPLIFSIFKQSITNSNLKSMKHLQRLLLLLFLTFPVISMAQNSMLKTISDFRLYKMAKGEYYRNPDISFKDIQGSPFLNDQFIKGTVTTTEGYRYVNVPLRYDQYQDELQFEKDGKPMIFSPKSIIKRAKFGDRTFTYTSYLFTGNKTKEGYFEILADGNVRLLAHHTIKFFEKEKEKPYVEPKPARFERPMEDFYIQIGALPAQHVSKKKNLLDAFPKHKKEVADYYKSNKLSAKDKEDLIKLVTYYNSLN